MGHLVSRGQRDVVLACIPELRKEADLLTKDPAHIGLCDILQHQSAFVRPTLLRVRDANQAAQVHAVEALVHTSNHYSD